MFTAEQEKILVGAYDDTAIAYTAHNLGEPPEVTPEEHHGIMFVNGIGEAFAGGQFRPAEYLPTTKANQDYFKSVQAMIRRNAANPSQETRKLGVAYGRWLAALFDFGGLERALPGLKVEDGCVGAGEWNVPCSLQDGIVVEYGMGVNGLLNHVANWRKEGGRNYEVTHIGNSKLENVVLSSMAQYYGVNELLTLRHEGISRTVADLAQDDKYAGRVNAIIASRVHEAEDLSVGIEAARNDLLCAGGVLALRGPRFVSEGTGYDDAAKTVIEAFGPKAVLINERYTLKGPAGAEGMDELGRTIIARHPGSFWKRLLGIKPATTAGPSS